MATTTTPETLLDLPADLLTLILTYCDAISLVSCDEASLLFREVVPEAAERRIISLVGQAVPQLTWSDIVVACSCELQRLARVEEQIDTAEGCIEIIADTSRDEDDRRGHHLVLLDVDATIRERLFGVDLLRFADADVNKVRALALIGLQDCSSAWLTANAEALVNKRLEDLPWEHRVWALDLLYKMDLDCILRCERALLRLVNDTNYEVQISLCGLLAKLGTSWLCAHPDVVTALVASNGARMEAVSCLLADEAVGTEVVAMHAHHLLALLPDWMNPVNLWTLRALGRLEPAWLKVHARGPVGHLLSVSNHTTSHSCRDSVVQEATALLSRLEL